METHFHSAETLDEFEAVSRIQTLPDVSVEGAQLSGSGILAGLLAATGQHALIIITDEDDDHADPSKQHILCRLDAQAGGAFDADTLELTFPTSSYVALVTTDPERVGLRTISEAFCLLKEEMALLLHTPDGTPREAVMHDSLHPIKIEIFVGDEEISQWASSRWDSHAPILLELDKALGGELRKQPRFADIIPALVEMYGHGLRKLKSEIATHARRLTEGTDIRDDEERNMVSELLKETEGELAEMARKVRLIELDQEPVLARLIEDVPAT